jgi:long-chain acyl-CoA synthetase
MGWVPTSTSRLSAAAWFDVGALADENARNFPGHVAVVDGDVRLTYAELARRASELARGMHAKGVEPGSRVLWVGQNSFRILEALLAAAKCGAVLCPANWRQSPDELSFILQDQDPALVLFEGRGLEGRFDAVRSVSLSQGTIWVACDEPPKEMELAYTDLFEIGDPSPGVDVEAGTPLLALYTAAFDGRPCAALLSHEAIFVQDLVIALEAGINGEYVYLNSGPLFHVSTIMYALATFHMGGTNVIMPKFNAQEFCRLVEVEGCTGAFLADAIIHSILGDPECGKYDLSSLRVPPSTKEWNDRITVKPSRSGARTGYGQTEVMGLATLTNPGGPATGSSGRPSPVVQLRIVDEEGDEVSDGEVGEIVLRGPTVMTSYYQRSGLNEFIQRGGWHHTRDLGRREVDGSITFIGPSGRLIKSGGENVYPVEVETALRKHSAISDVAIIGVPDPRWGQRVKAVIVLSEAREVTIEEVTQHSLQLIASYKKPTLLDVVEELPRLGDGRLDYDRIDLEHGGGGYPSSTRSQKKRVTNE